MPDNKLQLFVRSGAAQQSIEQTLKDRSDDFTTSLLTVINGNPVLQECEPQEVVRTALKAASMHLPIDPSLGLAYIIPYKNKIKIKEEYQNDKGQTLVRWKELYKYEPQLQVGWKGFVQLALRTGQYKTINVTDIREGELKGEDYLTGEMQFDWENDRAARKKLKVVGYVGYFKLHDGFEKILYMPVDDLENHAKKYSKSYSKGFGIWKDDKPAMSKKTVIKLLLSKWGPQSTEMQKAFRADQAAMGDDDAYNYLDNDKKPNKAAEPASDDDTDTNAPDAENGQQPAPSEPIDGEVV
jgi:recombination protein RecT